jgi:hypothetical protein
MPKLEDINRAAYKVVLKKALTKSIKPKSKDLEKAYKIYAPLIKMLHSKETPKRK